MSDIELKLTINEENMTLFKRCVRKLLDSTFIVNEKDPKLYAFLSKPSNRCDVSDYLHMIGYDVFVDENVKVGMLKVHEDDEETTGLKAANLLTFSNGQYHLLLILWEMYLEKVGISQETVVTQGEMIDKLNVYGVTLSKGQIGDSLRLFKKYSLLDCNPEDRSEDAEIRLYPSLQFGWDVKQLEEIFNEYINTSLYEVNNEEPSEESEDD